MNKGRCSLIGGGPGDPGLLTRRGLARLREADVVFYDALIDPVLLEEAPPEAPRIYVGKRAKEHAVPQAEICARLVAETRQGKRVVRLKGGDPFVFGRGGEEALALSEAGVDFEIVPGITSGIAACTYAGIPVTHRALSTGMTFVTGHETPDKPETQVDWGAIARLDHTICIFMGLGRIQEICAALLANSADPQRPAAVIQEGATPRQRVVTATIETLPEAVAEANLRPPAMIVIGPVVSLRESMQWIETRPLFGQTVLVTRARAQASELASKLAALGAQVLQTPAIRIEPVVMEGEKGLAEMVAHQGAITQYERQHCDPLTNAILGLAADPPDWVVFTSANGVRHAFDRIRALGWDARLFASTRLAVIGSGTAEALQERGLHADLMPERFVGEALAAALLASNDGQVSQTRFLLLRADNARAVLPQMLQEAGAIVEDITAYHVRPAAQLPADLRQKLTDGEIDWITFASSGTVRSFLALLEQADLLTGTTRPRIASIGPITSATLREAGLPIDAEAESHTLDGLVDAMTRDGGRDGA